MRRSLCVVTVLKARACALKITPPGARRAPSLKGAPRAHAGHALHVLRANAHEDVGAGWRARKAERNRDGAVDGGVGHCGPGGVRRGERVGVVR